MKVKLSKGEFKHNEYIHFETNNLASLVSKLLNDTKENLFEAIGSDVVAINLDSIPSGNTVVTDLNDDGVSEFHYILPIVDKRKAIRFQKACYEIGMEVEFGNHEEAVELFKELKSYSPKNIKKKNDLG